MTAARRSLTQWIHYTTGAGRRTWHPTEVAFVDKRILRGDRCEEQAINYTFGIWAEFIAIGRLDLTTGKER